VTWQPGRDKIAGLLGAAELQPVTADLRVGQLLLDDARRHLATAATALSSSDLSGAYQLAYDVLRKSAASLLAAQGLRATSRGGHIAIQEAAQAQFVSTIKAFRSFGRIRRARNSFEYPSTHAPGPSPDDVRDAIAAATQAHDAALKILEQNLLTPW
jgi:HEPN domain